MKTNLTFHTDNPNIDTVHFTLRLKQLFFKYNVFGKFDLPDELDCENGVFRYLYFADDKPIQLYHKFANNRLAYTQVQRLEIIFEMFKLTLEE
jgi:hypothetical protein